jgi:predicted  nucleic acid-binding Zn-ribbon protein
MFDLCKRMHQSATDTCSHLNSAAVALQAVAMERDLRSSRAAAAAAEVNRAATEAALQRAQRQAEQQAESSRAELEERARAVTEAQVRQREVGDRVRALEAEVEALRKGQEDALAQVQVGGSSGEQLCLVLVRGYAQCHLKHDLAVPSCACPHAVGVPAQRDTAAVREAN